MIPSSLGPPFSKYLRMYNNTRLETHSGKLVFPQWCSCRACGVAVEVKAVEWWHSNYPQLLDTYYDGRQLAHLSAKLTWSLQTQDGGDRVDLARTTYAAFLLHVAGKGAKALCCICATPSD
jgi:hypothetical protein